MNCKLQNLIYFLFLFRCQDPTELGSFMSALKCPDCESGYLLPIDSMDPESQWICSKCEHQQSSESVKKLKMDADAMRWDEIS